MADSNSTTIESVPAPAPPTAAEQQAIDRRWQENVDRFHNEERENNARNLWHWWNRGQFVRQVMYVDPNNKDGLGLRRDDCEWGGHNTEELAQAWKKKGTRSLQLMAQFQRDYSKEEVEQAIAQGVGWSTIVALLPMSHDRKKRLTWQTQVATGKLQPVDLAAMVKAETEKRLETKNKGRAAAGKAPARAAGPSPAKMLKIWTGTASSLEERMEDFKESYKTIKKTPLGERKAELVQSFRQARTATERLVKRLTTLLANTVLED